MKHILPLVISGFVLCGFFAVSLSAFLLPKSEPEPEPNQTVFYDEPINFYLADDFPFQFSFPNYLYNYPSDYTFRWFYSIDSEAFRLVPTSYNGTFYFISDFNGRNLIADYPQYIKTHNFVFRLVVLNGNSIIALHYFNFHFLPLPSSGSSFSSSLRSVDDAVAEEVPADQVDAAVEEVPVDQVDAVAEEDVSSEKNESEE